MRMEREKRWSTLIDFTRALVRHQIVHWRRYLSRRIKLAAAATCFAVTGLIAYLFDRLPDGWLETVLGNLDRPQGIVVAGLIALLGALWFAYYAAMHQLLHAH